MKGKTILTKSILMRLFLLLTAAVMALSLVLFTACAKPEEDEDEEDMTTGESVETDDQLIKNGNFNFLYDTSNSLDYPRTPKSWSYSIDGTGDTKAPSSSSDVLYGVINVTDKFDEVNKVSDKGEQKFGDIQNPKSPNGPDEKGNDNVLMLYNKNKTAIRYKSPSVAIATNAYLKISVWVKTVGIEDGGAHINVTGGVEEPIKIKNINTKDVPLDNGHNGYVQYDFFIAGSALQAKTVYLELGLGYGDMTQQREQMDGYVFFDDVVLEYVSQAEYANQLSDLGNSNYVKFEANGEPFEVENVYADNDVTNFAYDFQKQASSSTVNFTLKNNVFPTQPADKAVYQTFDAGSSSDTANFTDDQKKLLEDLPFETVSGMTLFSNTQPTSSMIKSTNTTLQAYKFYRLSFWLKTTEFEDGTGLSVYVTNGKDKNTAYPPTEVGYKSYGSLTNLSTPRDDKDLEDKDVTKDYKWQNWQQVNLLFTVGNYQNEDIALEFYIGPQYVDTTTNNQYEWDLVKGSAIFTQFTMEELTRGEYNSASTGTYSSKIAVSTSSTPTTTVANGGFSTPVTSYGTPDFSNGPLSPADWTGLPYSHKQLGGTGVADEDYKNVTSGIYNGLYGTNDKFETGNPSSLVIDAKITPTAYAYYTPYKSLSANTTYKITVDVMANTKFGIYLVDKDGKILGDSKYKAKTPGETTEEGKEKDPTDYDRFESDSKPTMFFEDTLDNLSTAIDGWKTYTFYVRTLADAKDFRIELWLGNKATEGKDVEKVTGQVYFDNVQISSSATSSFDKAVERAVDAGNMTKITDENKETVVEGSKDRFYKGDDIVIADYTKSNPTPPKEEEEEEEEDEDEDVPFNWGLLLTGIASLLMVAALATVIITKLVKNKKKHPSKAKKTKVKGMYDKNLKRHYGADEDSEASTDETDEEYDEDEDEDEETEADETETQSDEADEEDEDDIELGDAANSLDDEEDEDKE